MFLIAGISPRIKILDPKPRICPSCGLAQAHLKRVDSYFNLFFIPIFRVKKGEPMVICDRCDSFASETPPAYHGPPVGEEARCSACGRRLDREFKYCPACGTPINKVKSLDSY